MKTLILNFYVKFLQIISSVVILPILCISQQISWVEINGLPPCFTLREGADGKLFAVSYSLAYYSTNSGINWLKSSLRGDIRELINRHGLFVAYRNDDRIYDNEQVHISTNNGVTWQRIYGTHSPYYPDYSNFMISDSDVVFAIHYHDRQGIGVVRFDGQQWNDIGTLIPLGTYPNGSRAVVDHSNRMFVSLASKGGLYITTDFGMSWEKTFTNTWVSVLALSPSNEIIVGTNISRMSDGGVLKSRDGGTNWTMLGLVGKNILSLTCDSLGNIYTVTPDGIYFYSKSTDNWENISPSTNSFYDIFYSSTRTLYATNSDGIYRSTDYGSLWYSSSPRGCNIFTIATTPNGDIFTGTLGNRIFRSSDNGETWQQALPGALPDNVFSFGQKGSTMYAGTDHGLYSSVDSGSSWVNLTESSVTGSTYAVTVNNAGTVFIGTNFGVYSSTDDGLHWVQAGLQGSIVLFLASSNSNVLYAATDNDGVFVSTDNGNTWWNRGLIRKDIQTIAVNNIGDVYVGVYGGIFKSTDGGLTWTQKTFATSYIYSIAFNQDHGIFAGTYYGVYSSYDDGSSWTKAGLVNQIILGLALDQNQNLIAGTYTGGGVFRSALPVTSVELSSLELPTTTKLYQNYPNPFNPKTDLKFDLLLSKQDIAELKNVNLKVFDILGREVATLINSKLLAGVYTLSWDASDKPSGLYFYRLQVGDEIVDVKKMLLVR